MIFTEVIGVGAFICYMLAIIFDNVGLASLALGLTIYGIASQGGII